MKKVQKTKECMLEGTWLGGIVWGSLGNCLFPLQSQGLVGKMNPKNVGLIGGLEEVKQMAASRRQRICFILQWVPGGKLFQKVLPGITRSESSFLSEGEPRIRNGAQTGIQNQKGGKRIQHCQPIIF